MKLLKLFRKKDKVFYTNSTHYVKEDKVGLYIECRVCGLKSYDQEHIRSRDCPNCHVQWAD
jgi:rubrerythrin